MKSNQITKKGKRRPQEFGIDWKSNQIQSRMRMHSGHVFSLRIVLALIQKKITSNAADSSEIRPFSLSPLAFRLDVIILVTNDCMLIQATKCLWGVNDEGALKWHTVLSFGSFFRCCYRHQRHVKRYYSIRSNNDANACREMATTRWSDVWWRL